ncbi:hypothetical protein HQ590_13645 [bacterium]|nr:hypothetical protein [bacterium]
MTDNRPSQPSDARVCQTLKDGYWDRTEIIELADGSRRVRKRTKGLVAPGPWGVETLRREIRYLATLPPRARAVFPPLLATWDGEAGGQPDVGYEIPYYGDHVDAGELARRGSLGQDEVDAFQDELARAVLECLHQPVPMEDPLSAHLVATVRQALAGLETDPALTALVGADVVELNGRSGQGPRAAFESIVQESGALREIDAGPGVRLHGDLFLENILWAPARTGTGAARLILLDPVSVAGVTGGTPLFDLVKYESYATGELLALRSEWVDVEGFEDRVDGRSPRRYRYRIRWQDAALQPFQRLDWQTRFRQAYDAKYGPADRRLARLIDGYFSIAMAVNTSGAQRRARLLKATAEFNGVLAGL